MSPAPAPVRQRPSPRSDPVKKPPTATGEDGNPRKMPIYLRVVRQRPLPEGSDGGGGLGVIPHKLPMKSELNKGPESPWLVLRDEFTTISKRMDLEAAVRGAYLSKPDASLLPRLGKPIKAGKEVRYLTSENTVWYLVP